MYQLTLKLYDDYGHIVATGLNSLYEKEQQNLINFVNSCIDNLQKNKVKNFHFNLLTVNWLKTNINNYVIQINSREVNAIDVCYHLIAQINKKTVTPFKVYTKKYKY